MLPQARRPCAACAARLAKRSVSKRPLLRQLGARGAHDAAASAKSGRPAGMLCMTGTLRHRAPAAINGCEAAAMRAPQPGCRSAGGHSKARVRLPHGGATPLVCCWLRGWLERSALAARPIPVRAGPARTRQGWPVHCYCWGNVWSLRYPPPGSWSSSVPCFARRLLAAGAGGCLNLPVASRCVVFCAWACCSLVGGFFMLLRAYASAVVCPSGRVQLCGRWLCGGLGRGRPRVRGLLSLRT